VQGDYWMPGPYGVIYIVENYPGCSACGSEPALFIHRIVSPDDEWDHLPELEFPAKGARFVLEKP
jgi:hypothetical protein